MIHYTLIRDQCKLTAVCYPQKWQNEDLGRCRLRAGSKLNTGSVYPNLSRNIQHPLFGDSSSTPSPDAQWKNNQKILSFCSVFHFQSFLKFWNVLIKIWYFLCHSVFLIPTDSLHTAIVDYHMRSQVRWYPAPPVSNLMCFLKDFHQNRSRLIPPSVLFLGFSPPLVSPPPLFFYIGAAGEIFEDISLIFGDFWFSPPCSFTFQNKGGTKE